MNLSVNPATIADAGRVFVALSEGGVIRIPLQETFWNSRFGMLTGKFSTPWMINFEVAHPGA